MYQGKYQKDVPGGRPRKQTRFPVGTVVFYSVLAVVVIAFFVAMSFVTGALTDWLNRFEASQPHTKCEEVFTQLFAQPDWAEIYRLSGTEDAGDVNPDNYAAYMQTQVGDTKLNYIQTSAGLSGDRKYIVRADTRKLATFTLTQKDPDADIPEWVLGKVEIFYTKDEGCRVVTLPDHTVLVNGEPVPQQCYLKTEFTKAESYLPEGVHGYRRTEVEVDGYLVPPQVQILTPDGQEVKVAYDEETDTYFHALTPPLITEGEREAFVNVAKTYCKYMIGAVGKSELKQCFDSGSQIYATITSNTTWMQSYAGYEFGEALVTDFYRYSDKLCSARVSLLLKVNRKDGTVKEYELGSTFFLSGKDSFKVTQMINSNAQDKVTHVRLTYMDGETLLHTSMVDAAAHSLTPPAVTVPEGKVFAGWFTQATDDSGRTTMTLAFCPGEDGTVQLSGDTALTPMVLYALFNDGEG